MTTLLSVGYVQALVQNQVYALPTSRCLLMCDTAAATFLQSLTQAFTVSVALTPDANEQIEVAGGFIKCTSAGPTNVILKKV